MFRFSLKTALLFIVVLYIIFTPILIFPALNADSAFINKENTLDYYGVLELWQIDTFEGGSVSRAAWLEARALQFEKNNPGTFIMVRNMSEEQALLNLQNGNKPNLISYGVGFGNNIVTNLTNYTGRVQVRDDLKKGGMLNGNLLAVPYILGGYSLIGNEFFMSKASSDNDYNLFEDVFNFNTTHHKDTIYSTSFGANGYNNPALALALNTNLQASENAIDPKVNELTSYDAYEKYVMGNNASVLIGTQRDVYRCKNREANSNMEPNSYYFLEGFSDLIQYMSIFETDAETKYVCESFIEYLTTEEVQKTLSRISMFSTLDIKVYSTPFYREWEKVLNKPMNTLNVFLHKENISEKINLAIKALYGDAEARKKVNAIF